MNPKVHIFGDEREAYDMSQCRDDIKDGDVLLIPGVCAAVLYKAWPIIAAGVDRHEGQVLHSIVEGKTFRDLEDGEKYEESWALAENALFLYEHAKNWAGQSDRADWYARWYVLEYTQYEPGDWPVHNWAWTRFLEEGGEPQS